MLQKSAQAIATTALLGLLTLINSVFFTAPAAAAAGCGTSGSISPKQRQALKHLPPDLQTILKAVQRHKKASCQAPALTPMPIAAIDPFSIPLNSITPAPAPQVPDEVLAVITGDGSNIEAIARANGLVVRSRQRSALLGGFIVRFGIPDGRSTTAVTSSLQANNQVITPGPNHIYQLQGNTFDDSRFAPEKIGLTNNSTHLTGKDILIGIIDTAIDANHPDLKGAILDSFNALPDQKVLNKRHGTSVAGLIVGRSMIKGVAPQAKLLVARAFDDNTSGNAKASATSYQLLSALDWTVTKGAQIINMSFTGPRNVLLSKALAVAAQKNIVLIAAAGNNGPQAPAAYPAAEPSVLAVTATDIDDRIYPDANVGRYVFVAAPGVDVLAAVPDKGVDLVSGTSFAAPFLSGLAALMLEQNRTLTPRQFAKRIEQTSSDLGSPGRDNIFGVGLANSTRALSQN